MTNTPTRYFSLRSKLEPNPSRLPAVLLATLAVSTVVGVFLNIAALAA